MRPRGHRRGPARAGAVRDDSRSRGSARQSGAVPRARQRIANAGARGFGIPRRPHRSGRAHGVRHVGGRTGVLAHALAPGRISACLSCPARSRLGGVEAQLRADVPRARHPPTRHHGAGGDTPAILDHAGPLPRTGVERGGVRPCARVERRHRAAVSRLQDRLAMDPFSTQLFGFTNRRRTQCRILYWERC